MRITIKCQKVDVLEAPSFENDHGPTMPYLVFSCDNEKLLASALDHSMPFEGTFPRLLNGNLTGRHGYLSGFCGSEDIQVQMAPEVFVSVRTVLDGGTIHVYGSYMDRTPDYVPAFHVRVPLC